MVTEAQTVLSPYYCRASGGTTSGDAAATFAVLLGVAALRSKPILGLRSGGE